jgi:hypothetical protein
MITRQSGTQAGRVRVPSITPNYVTNLGKETSKETLMTPSRDWTDIRWSEAGLTDVSRWIAVLPLAATEQHGPHARAVARERSGDFPAC